MSSPMPTFEIRPHEAGWQLVMDSLAHSWVDLDDPTRLEFSYMQQMIDVIDTVWPEQQPISIVHIGGGALTIPRYIAHTRPHSAQIVLEPHEKMTEAVRAHLPLPKRSGIKVRPQRGEDGIETIRSRYSECLIIDAFADGRVPAALTTATFFSQAARILKDDGLLMMNLIDIRPFQWTRRVLATLREYFTQCALIAESATLKGRRHGNLVAIASHIPLRADDLYRRAASSVFPYRIVIDQPLDSLVGEASPFGEEGEESPQVERGLTHFS